MQVKTIKSEENQKFKSEELREQSFEMVMKTEQDSDDEFDMDNFDQDYKELDSHNEETFVKKRARKKRVKTDEQKTGKRAQRAERRMNEEFDETMLPSIEEKIRSFEQQIIHSPTNDREAKMNKNIERNIALQKAFREIVTTGCSNRKAASKVFTIGKVCQVILIFLFDQFGLAEASLRFFLARPESDCPGRGRKSKVFSMEEERRIAKR